MLDKIIEFKKEFGLHGVAMISALVAFAIGWYIKELLIYLQKIMAQGLTYIPTYGIIKTYERQFHERETMSYKFENTIGGQLLEQLREDIMQCYEVHNDMIPEEYHNNRDGVRTLADLDSMYQESNEPSQHVLDKAAKAERCEKYRQQWEANGSIEYDVDEYRLHKNELAFVEAAVKAGWMELDDE